MDIGQPPSLPRALRRRSRQRLAATTALSQRFEFETFEPRILMSAALLPVHGSIDVPGQTNRYTFSLADTTQIYFDSQTPNSSQIDWALQGPTGKVVSNQSFASSDANQVAGQAALSLAPGTYTLAVSAQGTTTGAYDFQLLDLANATPITVGQQVDGQLKPADATNLYRFQGTAGESLFFDSHALDAQSTTWRVIGPAGTVVFGANGLGQDSGPDTLTQTGTYTLMVEGNVNQTGASDYSFTVFPVTTTATALSLGQTVAGTLATPGATNQYNFTLAQPTRVLFDSLTNRSDLQWSLTGSPATVAIPGLFPTGVDATSTPLSGGAVDPNYIADSAAGADVLSTANQWSQWPEPGTGKWINYIDSTVTGGTHSFSTTFDLTGLDPTTAQISGVWSADNQTTMYLNGVAVASLPNDGFTSLHNFSITSGFVAGSNTLSFAVGEDGNDGLLISQISGTARALALPAATIVSPRAFNASDGSGIAGDDSVTLAAGSYTLNVSGVGSAVGAYGFQLLPISATSGTPTTLSDTHSGTIADAGFAAQGLHTTAVAPITLSPSYGPPLAPPAALALGVGQISAAVAPSPLLRPANLTVEAWVRLDFTASGQNAIFQQGAPGSGTGYGLKVGVDGNLQFEVDGTVVEAPTTLRLGTWTHAAGTYDGTTLRLYVNGVDVADQAFSGPITYDGNGATIGAADIAGDDLWHGELNELRVWNVAQTALAIKNNMAVTLGPMAGLVALWHLDETSGLTLADDSGNGLNATLGPIPGIATQLLTFNLTAGQTYYLNVVSSSGDLTERFYNPNGYLLFKQPLTDHAGITAEVSGTYTLSIEGGVGNAVPATYSIRLVPTVAATAPLTVGDAINDSVSLPSQSVTYSFTLTSDTRLLFDTLSADPGLRWSLTGPNGPEVTNRSLSASDGLNSPSLPLLDLAAGSYTLTVNAPGATTGAYSFRLLDATVGTSAAIKPFNLGDDVTATLDVPPGTVLYSFTATAGDTVSFNIESGANTAAWHLLDPYGRTVFGPSGAESQTGIVLGATGTYLLAIEGNLAAASVATIQFASSLDSHIDPAALTGTPITVGTPVNDSFSAQNSENDYIFTVAGGARLYFDSLTTESASIAYSLVGPRGVEIPSTVFYSADGTENQNPSEIDLPLAGTYQLRVTNSYFTGGYSFNLLDLTQPTAVLPTDGSTLQGALTPANATQVYTFNATAGTNVYLAASGSYNYYQNIDIRLIDPSGHEIQGPTSIGNMILAIPVTGTYTLLVEGERDNAYYSGNLSYSLALSNIADPAPIAVMSGQDISGQIAAGSETNRYTFKLASDSQLVLASFTGDNTVRMAVIGANGTIESFNLSQLVGYGSGSPVFSLAAGSYTLAVSSTDPTATPSYGFSVYNVATAQALTPNTPISATLQPNLAVSAFTIAAAAGTQLRIVTTRDVAGYYDRIVVLDPNGRPLAPPQSYQNNPAIFPITVSGTYTILFEGENYFGPTPSVGFTLTAYVDLAPTPVVFGTLTLGTLAGQNDIARYSFDLATDSNIVFNSLASDGNLNWTLTGPNGYSLSRNFYYSGSYELGGTNPILSLEAGSYTLTLTNSATTTDTYYFQVLNVANATPLTLGTPISNPDTPGNQTLLYSFNATQGAPLSLTTTDPSSMLSIRLFDPYGQEIVGPTGTGIRLITPTATGVYTVMVEGRVWDATPRPFTIAINSVPQQTVALSGPNGLSGPVGPFSQPGQIGNALAFTGLDSIQVPDQPALDLGASFTLQAWINPDRIDGSIMPILTKSGGENYSYAIGLDSGDRVWMKFSDANNNNIIYTTYGMAPGNTWTQVTGVVDGVAHTMTIYINGVQAAQQNFGTYNPVDSGSPLVIAADQPLGAFGDGAFQGLIQQVAVWNVARGANDIQSSYNAALVANEAGLALYLPLNDATGSTMVVDQGPHSLTANVVYAFAGLSNVVEGRITAPFGTATYTFSLAQATTFVIDGLSDDTAFSVTLTGPKGLSVTRNIAQSDSYEFNGNPAFAAGPGNYTLVVSETVGHIGSFAFRLLDLSAATQIALDTPISFTLPAGFATQAFSFNANAGDHVVFDSLALPVDPGYMTTRIIDPLGRLLFGPVNYSVQTGIPVLPLTGTYTLLIEGRTYYDRTGPLALGFALDRVQANPLTLQLGAPNPTPGPFWGAGITAGQGLTVTGADEVTVPDGSATSQTGSFTVEAMVNLTRFGGYTPIVTKVAANGSSGGQQRAFGLYVNSNGSIVATTRDASGDQSVTSAAGLVGLNQWVDLAMVVDRTLGTLEVLLNGVVVGTSSIRTTAGIAVDGPLVIGATHEADTGYGRLEGGLAYVRMWSVALTAADIGAAIVTPPASNADGLVLDLPFIEGSGTVSANIAPPGGLATLVGFNTDGVTGEIDRAGESNVYSFTVTQTTRIVVDSLSGNNQLNWSLNGPYGGIAGALLSNANGFDFGNNPVYTLQAGTYTFTVASVGDGVGYYNIRLLDIAAQATALTPGTAVSGVLDPASHTTIYNFTATAGQTLFFDPISGSGEVSWRLIDPFGRQTQAAAGFNEESITLAYSGTWTILIEGRSTQSGRATYSFDAILTPVVTVALTLGATVNSAITIPSQQNVYTFTLAKATQAVFDSLTNDGNMSWTLTGSGGTIVNARAFNNSNNIGGSTALQLQAGAYTLTVQDYQANTGSYGFRLLDVSAGTSVAADTPVNGTLGDSGTDINVYLFSATARERVDIQGTDSSPGTTSWRLMDQFGSVVFGPTGMGDSGPLTLAAGVYTLLIEGSVAATSDTTYNFTIASVPQQSANGQTTQDFDTANLLPYALGSFGGTAATLTTGATGNALRLNNGDNGYQDNAAYFPVTQDGPLASVTIDLDLTITPADQSNRNSSVVVALLDADTWGNSGVGPDLFTNAGLANSLGIALDANNSYGGDGSSNHVAIRTAAGLVSQQFVTPANVDLGSGTPVHATITVTQVDGGGNVTVVLTPQGGAAFTAVSNLFVAGYVLKPSRVAIGGQSYYSSTTQTVDNVAIQAVSGAASATSITLGQTVSGSITVPNAVEQYAFDVTQNTTVVFDGLTTNPGYLYWTMVGPNGHFGGIYFSSSDSANIGGNNLLSLAPGHYVLSVAANYQYTGAYSFRLLDISTATPISIGSISDTPITADFPVADQTDLYSFTGTAGQVLYFNNPGGQPNVYYRILDPNGVLVTGPNYINNTTGPVTLTKTGTYLLELEGAYYSGSSTSFQFQLVDASDQLGTLTLNQAFTGSVSQPGQRDVHSFTLTQTTIVYADALDGNGNLTWQLVGPQGVVDSRNFRNTDGVARAGTDPVGLTLAPGSYQFIVTDNGNQTAGYTFRLLDLGAGTPLTLGADTPISLDPADGTQAYAIAANAGDVLHLSVTGGNNVSLRLIDSTGRVISYLPNANLGITTPTLALTGSYTLLIEGYIDAGSGAQGLTLRADKVVNPVTATTLGAQVETVVATPGQQQVYTFTVATPRNVLIDPLGYDSRFYWTLTYPDGTRVTRLFNQSLSTTNYNDPNPMLQLGAGQYTLAIGANQNATGTASVRIVDATAAPAITPGVPISGSLAPVGQANVFQLNGQAGDIFYFQPQQQAGGYATWQLVDPNGNTIFLQGFGSGGQYTLAATGTYYLLVMDENNDYAPPLTYGFNVFDDTLSTPVPIAVVNNTPAPDLQVQGLAVSASGGTIQSGASITVSWQDVNIGNVAAAAAWSDRLLITNVTTGAIIADQRLDSGVTALAAAGSLARQVTLSLPSGTAGTGQLSVRVITDVDNTLSESNPTGTATSNNSTSVTVTSTLAVYPDLVASNVTATPTGNYTPGEPVTVTWTTTNQGTASTGALGWTDQLIVRNTTTGDQIATASVVQQDGSPLAAGASVQRSVQIAWPSGGDSTGNFSFVVTTDSTNRIVEANATDSGESNNQDSLGVLSAPDIVVQNLQQQAGSTAQAGGQLTLTWTDANIGTAPTPNAWSDLVQITNQTTGQQLVLVAVPANPGPATLLPGGTFNRSVTITLPDLAAAVGDLTVTVISDRDINNNTQITQVAPNGNGVYQNNQQITVTSIASPHADLIASAISVPTSGTGGASIIVGYTVTNTGVAATDASSWTDEIVFSPTVALNSATEIVLGSFVHNGTLAAGASYNATDTVTLPNQFNATGYIAVLTDPAGAVTEPNRGQEYITGPAAIVVTSPYADLTTEAVSAPTSANDGDLITISWRVRNLGDAATAAAGGWTDKVYLSQTDRVTSSSILLGEVPHSAGLAVGASYTGKASFALPGGVTGAYHVLVVTDANSADYQGGRTSNDTGEAPAALLINAQPSPDLTVTAVSVPAVTVPGVPTTITFTVQNVGEAIARGPWTDQLVLLYGANFANSSLLATVQRVNDLAVGASYTVTETVTLPALPDGPVEIAATTDVAQSVSEAGRFANNTFDSAVFNTTHPDLVPGQVQAPATIVSGQNLTVSWTTTNNGTGPALPGWTETVTLVQGTTTTVIGTVTQTTPLAAGASLARQITDALPISLSGAFQVLVTVDSGNAVAETSGTRTDNTASVPLSVTLAPYADLAVSNVTAPAVTIADPATVTIGWTVTNNGTGAGITSTWTDQVIVSASGLVGNSDNLVLGRYVHNGGLAVGASYSNSQTITLPPGFNGRYHLIVLTNAGGTVFENGLTANNQAQPPTPFDVVPYPYADNVVTSVTPAAGAASGKSLSLTWVVTNQGIGTTDTSEWVDNVYLSQTPDGANKLLLGEFDHLGFLAVGGSYTRTAQVTLPDGISGPYYFIVVTAGSSTPNFNAAVPGVVDQGSIGSPYEFVFTNNDSSVSPVTNLELTPAPDLVVSSVTIPPTATEGTAINVIWTVKNQGGGPANGSWTDNVLLQQVGDANPGTVVGTFTFTGPLIAGQSYTRTGQITLPLHTTGAYNLIVVTNANGVVYEGAGANNNQTVSTTPILVSALPRPDLAVTSIAAPATINAGAAASVSYVVTNVGPVGTGSTQWTDKVYLSLESTINTDSILVSTLPAGSALASGQQYSNDAASFVVPLRYAGTVYLIVQTNAGGTVDEYPNGGNDITVKQLFVNPAPLADLVVSNVTAPSLSFPNQQATVNFTVTNKGAGSTNLANYAEQIWLTTDKQRPNPGKGDILLTEVQYSGGILAPGQGYDQTITVTLPKNVVSGTYYLTPWVDPYETLIQAELANHLNPDDPNEIQNDNYKAGNSTTGGTEIIGLPPAPPALKPDVAVTVLTPDPTGTATQNFTVSWTVTNSGPGAAVESSESPWQDTVYLTNAPTLTASTETWTLGTYERLQDLQVGQNYTNTQTVLLNPGARGQYIIVVTSLATDPNATNNSATAATNVSGGVPDLQVSKVALPTSVNSGDPLTVNYTVTNNSATPIWSGSAFWADNIFISRDSTFIPGRATLLGTVQHANTGVSAGGSYTDSLTANVPQGVGGTFYIYVFVNQSLGAIPLPTTGGDNANALQFYSAHAYEDPANNSGSAPFQIV
jgi:hypothetical protein